MGRRRKTSLETLPALYCRSLFIDMNEEFKKLRISVAVQDLKISFYLQKLSFYLLPPSTFG